MWGDFDVNLPDWAEFITFSLMQHVEVEKLQQLRIEGLNEIQQIRKKEQEEYEKQRLKEIDNELKKYLNDSFIRYSDAEINVMRQKVIDAPFFSSDDVVEYVIKEAEFEHLVSEMQMHKFSESAQVSNYIVRNKLGKKYENISGYLTMTNNNDVWEFKGGFPSDIYAKLCMRLGIQGRGTTTRALSFRSFKQGR